MEIKQAEIILLNLYLIFVFVYWVVREKGNIRNEKIRFLLALSLVSITFLLLIYIIGFSSWN